MGGWHTLVGLESKDSCCVAMLFGTWLSTSIGLWIDATVTVIFFFFKFKLTETIGLKVYLINSLEGVFPNKCAIFRWEQVPWINNANTELRPLISHILLKLVGPQQQLHHVKLTEFPEILAVLLFTSASFGSCITLSCGQMSCSLNYCKRNMLKIHFEFDGNSTSGPPKSLKMKYLMYM